MRRAFVLAPLALLAAGCGGSSPELGGAAQFLPPNTVAFVAARGDAQWRQLAKRILKQLPATPAGADEIDIALLQGGETVVFAKRDGRWTSTRAQKRPSLADAPHFRAAWNAAPAGAVARAYLRGDLARTRLVAVPGQLLLASAFLRSKYRPAPNATANVGFAYLELAWGAAWLTKDGMGFRGHAAGPPLARALHIRAVEQLMPPYTPALVDEIPADAVRVLDLRVPLGAFGLMEHLPPLLARVLPSTGDVVRSELDAIVGGETAVYARPGGEVTLITSPRDLRTAEDALAELLQSPIAGVATLSHASVGGELVISTKPSGIAVFRGSGPKLSADAAFRKAGFPAQLTLLAYELGKTAAWATPAGADPTFTVRFDRDGS